jgi:hypothetical protein
MADAVTIPAGRTGETILIVAILGAGAFIAWRKGIFAGPRPVETPAGPVTFRNRLTRPDAALPAVSTVQQAISNVSPPVTDAQKNVLAAEKPPAVATTTGIGPAFQSAGDAIARSRLGTAKPPAVAATVGTTASAPMGLPSLFSKRTTVAIRPVAAPAVLAPPPMPPPPKPISFVSPVPPSSGMPRPGFVTAALGAKKAIKYVAPPAPKPAPKPFPLQVGFRR